MVTNREREQKRSFSGDLDLNADYVDALSLWKFVKLYKYDICIYLKVYYT